MRFVHMADVHLGAEPSAGSAYTKERAGELWESFRRAIEFCEKERIELLLIAGDLFHRQPLRRELKEADYLFSTLSVTQVVFIAGNHDYIKKDSCYLTFPFSPNVRFLSGRRLGKVVFEALDTEVYGLSYYAREAAENLYRTAFADKGGRIKLLLAHGGDERHSPFQREELAGLGYDYIALGHIHRYKEVIGQRAAYSGALEPVDKSDTGKHGFILGEIKRGKCRIEFVPFAKREYIELCVEVGEETTGYALRDVLKKEIEERGRQNIYKVTLTGFRAFDTEFDSGSLKACGNILEIKDKSAPAYDFKGLWEKNKENLLGKYIESFKERPADKEDYQALCEGVKALIRTRRE